MNLKFIGGLAQSAKIPTGGRELWEVWGAGPSSYNQTNGDTVYSPGVGEHLSGIASAVSASGNYEVKFKPSVTNALRPSWTARWFFTNAGGASGVASVAQNAAGTGMTPGTYPITFSSGSAAGTVTVTATTVTSAKITNPGSYTTAPTATIGGSPGGTPATLTVNMSTAGEEVATGAVLSGETIQTFASGGQM